MPSTILLSIQVGLPEDLGVEGSANPRHRPWRTAFRKLPVEAPVWLGVVGLEGDAQVERNGSPELAVLAYAADHYPRWRSELELPELAHGGFGENFTVSAITEGSVCVGDVFAVGDARVQVSQPRVPCRNISRFWGRADFTGRVRATGRTGWYMRVLEEGLLRPGLPLTLEERPFPQWTVTRATRVMRDRRARPDAAAELASCPLLSPEWRAALAPHA